MKMMLAATCVAAAAASGDVIDTLSDWDAESYTGGWKKVGQVLTVPTESSTLVSFTIAPSEWSDGDGTYIFSIYDWDPVGGHAVGGPHYTAFGEIPDDLDTCKHEIGVDLTPGSMIVAVVNLNVPEPGFAGLGFVDADLYEGGHIVATFGDLHDPWGLINENVESAFTAVFTGCAADVDGSGLLSILDFIAFQSLFAAGDMSADFNDDGVLNILDFVAFQAAFKAGC